MKNTSTTLLLLSGLVRWLFLPFLFTPNLPAYAQQEATAPYSGKPLMILECKGHNFTWGSVAVAHTVVIYPDAATFDGWWYSLTTTDEQFTLSQLPVPKQTVGDLSRPKTITINRITGQYDIPAGAITDSDLSLPGDDGCKEVHRKF